jgi:hypothetical protein
MFNLSYNGQKRVESNSRKQAHDLLDALLDVHNADSVVDVDVGQVRPRGDALAVIVSLSATADMSALESVEADLATALVDLGIEPTEAEAKDNIQITN